MRTREWGLILAVAAAPAALTAQVSVRTELVAASGYLWRGLTRHRTPVLQGLGAVTVSGKLMSVELSTWGSGVTGDCDRPLCPEGTGARLADANASVMGSFDMPGMSGHRISLGANLYHFRPAPFDLTRRSASTWEAVASIYPVPSRHPQLRLTTWLDLGDVNGLYAEGAITLPLTSRTHEPPKYFLTLTLGWSQGQTIEENGGPAPGYFGRNGLTHVSLEASRLMVRPRSGKGITVQAFGRIQGNLDPATKTPVWPFKRGGTDQQLVMGLAVHPVVSAGSRPSDRR
jgi:hypothetical protein